jgi:hypothetical protein
MHELSNSSFHHGHHHGDSVEDSRSRRHGHHHKFGFSVGALLVVLALVTFVGVCCGCVWYRVGRCHSMRAAMRAGGVSVPVRAPVKDVVLIPDVQVFTPTA